MAETYPSSHDIPTYPTTSVVQWRAIFAGVLIATLIHFILMSLGVALGAGELREGLDLTEGSPNLSLHAGMWLIASVLISLGVGSYASSRVSGLIATRVGFVQGGVISALFFSLMVTQAGAAVGLIGSGLSALKDVVGGVAAQSLSNQRISGLLEDALGDLNFRQSPETVARGVLSRLLRGNADSAVTFLAAQSGISREVARTRMDSLNAKLRATSAQIAARSEEIARSMGWAVFGTLVLGSAVAMFFGAAGAQRNMRQPISRLDRRALRLQRPAYS